jgi:hypothetical protein
MTHGFATSRCADCGATPIAGYLNRTALCIVCVRTRWERTDQEIAERARASSDRALDDVPTWALDDPEWGPVCWLLTAPVLVLEGALRFVDFERRDIDWRALLEASRGWSSSGDLLARVAFNLWNGGTPALLNTGDGRGPGTVAALVSQLDGTNFERLLEAMAMSRGRRVVVLLPASPARTVATGEEQR